MTGRARRTLPLLAAIACALVAPAHAAPMASAATASFWYAGTRLTFERPQLRAGSLAVATDDPGLARFLIKLGATLAYQPGGNNIIVTSGDRRIVTFTIGDTRASVDGVVQPVAFAPYASGGAGYVPFLDLARALAVIAVDDGTTTVLEPQLSAIDVRNDARVTVVTFRGASPLRFRRLSDRNDEQLSLAFTGIASEIVRERTIAGAAVRGVSLVVSGSPRNPLTVANFEATPGSTHVLVPGDSPNSLSIAFAPPGVTLGGTPIPPEGLATIATAPLVVREAREPRVAAAPAAALAAPAAAQPAPPPTRAAITPTALTLPVATVTNYATSDGDNRIGVHLDITGDVTYEWHRLPDNRWYVDLKPASLAIATQDVPLQNSAIDSLRIKSFVGPNDKLPTVRVALSLASPRMVTLVPDQSGLTLAIDRLDDASATRTATGQIASGKLVAAVPLPQPVVAPVATAAPDDTAAADPAWKFSAAPSVARNSKLVVIDPGHGGSDTGAAHNGLTEATLNLDLSRRLRSLLVARGWQVKLTRDGDSDVYGANASAHDELQARDDVANAAGARMFISMHTNSFTSSSLNGTTTYYYNPDSYGFAAAVHARLAATLPTKDDGIRKENFYVIHHAKMPSILIETAFLSNAADAALLKSEAFLQSVAVSIADGVRDFANTQTTSASSHDGVDGQ
ncbi:MAG: hypothetical protein NVS2B8_06910 [Vulcanimicrobiaceae bacterium]